MIMNGLFNEVDEDILSDLNKSISDLNELSNGSVKMRDYSLEMLNSAKELKTKLNESMSNSIDVSGMNTLIDYLIAYLNNVNSEAIGQAQAISESTINSSNLSEEDKQTLNSLLQENLSQINVSSGNEELINSLMSVKNGLSTLDTNSSLDEVNKVMDQLINACQKLYDTNNDLVNNSIGDLKDLANNRLSKTYTLLNELKESDNNEYNYSGKVEDYHYQFIYETNGVN